MKAAVERFKGSGFEGSRHPLRPTLPAAQPANGPEGTRNSEPANVHPERKPTACRTFWKMIF